jgi:hypothetical protein
VGVAGQMDGLQRHLPERLGGKRLVVALISQQQRLGVQLAGKRLVTAVVA